MPSTEEQRLDLIENCDILLEGVLKSFKQTDDTPEGRMITQLKWLKERAQNHDLHLPIHQDYLATIRYVYTDGELCRHAASPNKAWQEIEVPQKNVIRLAKDGNLLYKKPYQPFVIRTIDMLISTLDCPSRTLSYYEEGFAYELRNIKSGLANSTISPPIGSYTRYPNLIECEDTISDIPNATSLFKIFDGAVFNGVRPDTWLTPELADKETKELAAKIKNQ